VEAYCAAAARLLAPGAPFVACAAAWQRPRVAAAAAAAGLSLVSWMDVVPKDGKAPLFAVYTARRALEATACAEEAPLVIRGRDGRFTPGFGAVCRAMGMPV
jgi:hypothetical protein